MSLVTLKTHNNMRKHPESGVVALETLRLEDPDGRLPWATQQDLSLFYFILDPAS